MGNYNPHAPQILGQEWVPIRDENLAFSPIVNSLEVGTIYNQPAAQRVRDARFYVDQVPAPPNGFQTAMVNIYPAGTEDETGPIRQVIIPCSSGAITGANMTLFGASTVAEAVYLPGDSKYIEVAYNSGTPQRFGMFFAVNQYPVLGNKRILNVSLLYAGSVSDTDPVSGDQASFISPDPAVFLTSVDQMNDAGVGQTFSPPTFSANTGTLDQIASTINAATSAVNSNQVLGVLSLGDVNNFWNPAASPGSTEERLPWRYVDLQRFEASAANRMMIRIQTQIPQTKLSGTSNSVNMRLDYFALRVIYCEEKRLAYGGRKFIAYNRGANIITMRDQSFVTDPVLPAGQYLPTLSWVSPGQITFGSGLLGDFPKLNAVEELYQIPSHPGVQVNVPFPLEDRIESTFTSEFTHILPQLTLHASGGTLTDPHAYGRQAAAQVYGANTATQEIYDDISGVSASYPQVRYYARRFGDTTVPLTLTGSGALVGSTASITVADFDALAEILDGWREVTLRFSAAPTMGAVTGTPGWTWSAVGETAGNRWEVLAASAPAISGVPSNLYNLVPSPNQLGTGTYQPVLGDTVNLNWMPQGVASPWVTGASDDAATDAVLIFSQDPPTITGVTLTAQTQTVTGIGLDCGTLPCCIPSGISYQQVTWSLPNGSVGLGLDGFTEVDATGWGSADVGGSWTPSGPAAEYSKTGVIGTITPSVERYITLANIGANFDIIGHMGLQAVPATSTGRVGLLGRFTDSSNHMVLQIQTSAVTQLSVALITHRIAGVSSTIVGPVTLPVSVNAGAMVWARFMCNGTSVKAKIWPGEITDEPASWLLEGTESSLTTGNGAGAYARSDVVSPGNVAIFDYFKAGPPAYWFGGYELQRYDTVTQEFETIMLATDPGLSSFNDFEARVGITSVYRIRSLNALNFAGQWSATVSGAPPTPGVTGGCTNMTGALIFTSNADQSGASNAAYAMVWENDPIEDFKLAEADMVTFQPMYGRDGSIAFHGTERGLEAFDRTLLLQSAAIDPTRLADAKTIRDLAWNGLPYICVRDDIGDRWFANVRIPAVNARLNRTKYMARVEITETTLTPYPVNP